MRSNGKYFLENLADEDHAHTKNLLIVLISSFFTLSGECITHTFLLSRKVLKFFIALLVILCLPWQKYLMFARKFRRSHKYLFQFSVKELSVLFIAIIYRFPPKRFAILKFLSFLRNIFQVQKEHKCISSC